MVWADPELDDGADDGSRLLELAVGLGVALELLDAAFDVAFAEVGVLASAAAARDVAVAPGRVNATTPAVTSPAAPTDTVAARSLARPRRRAATADRASSLRLFMGSPVRSQVCVKLGRTKSRPAPYAAPTQNL